MTIRNDYDQVPKNTTITTCKTSTGTTTMTRRRQQQAKGYKPKCLYLLYVVYVIRVQHQDSLYELILAEPPGRVPFPSPSPGALEDLPAGAVPLGNNVGPPPFLGAPPLHSHVWLSALPYPPNARVRVRPGSAAPPLSLSPPVSIFTLSSPSLFPPSILGSPPLDRKSVV